MNKNKYYFIVIILFALFTFIMNSGDLLKKPLGAEDNFMLYHTKIQNNIINQEWEQALSNKEKLSTAWRKITSRIQFSVEKNEINAINAGIARLQGALTSRDPQAALIELSEIREHWENLNH